MAKSKKVRESYLPPTPQQLYGYLRNTLSSEERYLFEKKLVKSRILQSSISALSKLVDENDWTDEIKEMNNKVSELTGYTEGNIKKMSIHPAIPIATASVAILITVFFLITNRPEKEKQSLATEEVVPFTEDNPIQKDSIATVSTIVADSIQRDSTTADPSPTLANTTSSTATVGEIKEESRPIQEKPEKMVNLPDTIKKTEENPYRPPEKKDTAIQEGNSTSIVIEPETELVEKKVEETESKPAPNDPTTTTPTQPLNRPEAIPQGGTQNFKNVLTKQIGTVAGASINLTIEEDGTVSRVRISGVDSEIESQIENTVSNTKWLPAIKEGTPVKSKIKINFN